MAASVFIASSTEGLPVARTVHKLLARRLGGLARFQRWDKKGAFALNRAYIESLEHSIRTTDFAVLVLTKDDGLMFRKQAKRAPRDNVVFELGLFTGSLGRERVFYLWPRELKLPSDLLGVHAPEFVLSRGVSMSAALGPACAQIADSIRDAIRNLPTLPKLTDHQRTAQGDVRRFVDRVNGSWWEYIFLKGEIQALSFFTISIEETYNSVHLNGQAFGKDGRLRAYWRSAGARLEGANITYVRECKHYARGTEPRWKPGLGILDFQTLGSDGLIDEGYGEFWEGDPDRPRRTVVKGTTVRRVRDRSYERVMTKGAQKAQQQLVQKLLQELDI